MVMNTCTFDFLANTRRYLKYLRERFCSGCHLPVAMSTLWCKIRRRLLSVCVHSSDRRKKGANMANELSA